MMNIQFLTHVKGNSRQSRILDSKQWIPDSRFQVADFLSVELGFRIPKLWIPDSKSKISRILPGLTLKIISTSKKGIRIITLISGIGLLCGL